MAKQFALLAAALLAALPAASQTPAPAPPPLKVPDVAPMNAPFAMGYALAAVSAAVEPALMAAGTAPVTTAKAPAPQKPKPGPATPAVAAKPSAPLKPAAPAVKPAASTVKPPVAAAKPSAPPTPEPKPAMPKPTPQPEAAGQLVRGPINVLALQREGRVKVSHSKLADGSADLVFDGNRHTFARGEARALASAEGAPAPTTAYWQVTLDRPRLLDEVNVAFTPTVQHNWTLLAADSEADMAARKGSFRQLFQPRVPQFEGRDQVPFPAPKAYRVYRVEARRISGPGGPELAEWSMWTPQQLARMDVDSFVSNVVVGQKIQLRAAATFEAGASQNMTPDVKWEVVPPAAGEVDDLGRFEGKLPGAARIFAVNGPRRSHPLAVEVMPAGQPDWTVTYIERQPRLHYGEEAPALKIGQTVYWFAHVRNYGTSNSEAVAVEWRLDGKVIRAGNIPKLERFAQTEIILGLPWDAAPHDLELVVDPQSEVPEVSETNNRLSVRTDALSVGFWVEDSTLRYFHRHQKELGTGSNSFEDWAQRQVQFWNRWMEGSAWLWKDRRKASTRYRLDRIIVVGDGMLPMAGGSATRDPDRRDDTVHVTVGVPAFDPAQSKLFGRTTEKSMDNPFYYHGWLLHLLGPSRFPQPAKMEAAAK